MNPTCVDCSKAAKKDRLPPGWKRRSDKVYCDVCWRKLYVLRAISIPVLRPLGAGIGWPELRKALSVAWGNSTACANWMATEMYSRDVRRTGEKIAPMPKMYLYPEATKRFPEMPPAAVSGMEQVIGKKYRASRYKVIWTAEVSTANYRYPYPAAFPRQSWKPSYESAGAEGGDDVPCVSVALQRGERFLLRLRGGKEFYRQLRDFKAIVDGTAIAGEISFVRKRVGGDHYNGVADRDSGGQHAKYRVMCKIVGWFSRPAQNTRDGTLSVRTDIDSILVALDEKNQRLWWHNGDYLRRGQARHTRRLHRWSEDQKHELRPGPAPFQSLRECATQNHRNWLNSSIQQIATQVCGLAQRRRYATVKYDDTDKRYLPGFPWAALETRMKIKCDEIGLVFESARANVAQDDVETARENLTNGGT